MITICGEKILAEQLYIVLPSAVKYGCLLDQVAVGWGFPPVLRPNTVIVIEPLLHIHPHQQLHAHVSAYNQTIIRLYKGIKKIKCTTQITLSLFPGFKRPVDIGT